MSSPTRFARAGDLDVAYDRVGAGPTVVLAHGGLGSRRMWRPQVEALRGRYELIAYDLRGHGETRADSRPERTTARLLAEDLARFADALGLECFGLVGCSVGGFLAQELAIAQPQRVGALVLADTWAKTGLDDRGAAVGQLLSPVVVGALRLLGTAPLARLAAATMAAEGDSRQLVADATAGTDREEAVRIWLGLGEHDTLERLEAIAAPTLVVVGERDPAPRAQAELLRERIPDARVVTIPGAGHITNLQRPAAFTAVVGSFLDEVLRS